MKVTEERMEQENTDTKIRKERIFKMEEVKSVKYHRDNEVKKDRG